MFLKLTLWGYGLQSPLKDIGEMSKIRKKYIVIREKINIMRKVLDCRKLKWYGHVRKMNEEKLSQKKWHWCPLGTGKEGIFRIS